MPQADQSPREQRPHRGSRCKRVNAQHNRSDLGRMVPCREADASAERMEMKQRSGVDKRLSSQRRWQEMQTQM